MYHGSLRVITPPVVLLLCITSFAQSAPHARPTPTFHIQGTISSAWDSLFKNQAVPQSKVSFQGKQVIRVLGRDDEDSYIAVPRSWVTFRGEHVSRTVVVDDKGFYSTDLPVGLYKMTVEGPSVGIQKLAPYVRLFRVTSPTTIVLNGSLYMAQMTCDDIGGPEQRKDDCGSEDSFSIPAKDGLPFEFFVRYPQRQTANRGYLYRSEKTTRPDVPVFAAYNLFSLEADVVFYDPKNRTVAASGNVVMEDGSGATHRADSMSFRLEDGKAIPLN